jgi:hypothetical protein
MRAAFLFLGLSACIVAPPGGAPVRAVALYDGGVVAQGPAGFCIDLGASRPATGFAVLGPCPVLPDAGAGPAGATGLITLQVGPEGSAAVTGAEPELQAYLRSVDGFRLLSDQGRPDTVTLIGSDSAPGVVLVRLEDRGPPLAPGLSSRELRAFVDLAGRLATVTLRALDRAPLTERDADALLVAAIATLRAANAADPG